MRKYLYLTCFCGLLEIAIVLGLTFWREHFWSNVVAKDIHGSLVYLGIFSVVTLVLCFVATVGTYAGTRASIRWREILNMKALGLKTSKIENMRQRVQEDCFQYPKLVIELGGGLLKALIYVIVFATAIVYGFKLSWLLYMAAYSIGATIIARYIGHPLVQLNYRIQQAEATYRSKLSKNNFITCIITQIAIAKKVKHLQYFQNFYGQLSIIIPLIIIAPDYFYNHITFGQLMQANSTMSTLDENLSYGIYTFNDTNKLLSCRRRLIEAKII